jgi:hypothetical protein
MLSFFLGTSPAVQGPGNPNGHTSAIIIETAWKIPVPASHKPLNNIIPSFSFHNTAFRPDPNSYPTDFPFKPSCLTYRREPLPNTQQEIFFGKTIRNITTLCGHLVQQTLMKDSVPAL